MTFNRQRLSDLASIQQTVNSAAKARDISAISSARSVHNALKLKALTREIQAAYGPTLRFMQGMDEFS
jgi:hypothetical protein